MYPVFKFMYQNTLGLCLTEAFIQGNHTYICIFTYCICCVWLKVHHWLYFHKIITTCVRNYMHTYSIIICDHGSYVYYLDKKFDILFFKYTVSHVIYILQIALTVRKIFS